MTSGRLAFVPGLLPPSSRSSPAELEIRQRAQQCPKIAGIVLEIGGFLVGLEGHADGRESLVQSDAVEQGDDFLHVVAYRRRIDGSAWGWYLDADEQLCGIWKPCPCAIQSLAGLQGRMQWEVERDDLCPDCDYKASVTLRRFESFLADGF